VETAGWDAAGVPGSGQRSAGSVRHTAGSVQRSEAATGAEVFGSPDAGVGALPGDPADTGRHHVPDALLQARTYQLSADRRARARVPGSDERSHVVPGQGRHQPKRRRGAASDDAPVRS
jgi:hypothetical protein